MDARCGVIAVQVKVRYDSRRETRIQLGPTETQPAHEAQHHQDGAVDGQERGGHHGVATSVSHHPNDAGPHQQSERQPVVVGDTPHLERLSDSCSCKVFAPTGEKC